MLVLIKLNETFHKAEFVNGDHCVLDAQVVKSGEEIKCMHVSRSLATVAMDRAIRKIDAGVRECEILAEAMHSLYLLTDRVLREKAAKMFELMNG